MSTRRLSKRVASQPARLPKPAAGRDAITLLRTYPQIELFANTLSSLDDNSLVALSVVSKALRDVMHDEALAELWQLSFKGVCMY